jgi:hypothetical protein
MPPSDGQYRRVARSDAAHADAPPVYDRRHGGAARSYPRGLDAVFETERRNALRLLRPTALRRLFRAEWPATADEPGDSRRAPAI